MARERIGRSAKKKSIDLKFKPRPKSKSTLFGKQMNSKLSKGEESYYLIVEGLEGKDFEPTLNQVGAFFALQYRFKFEIDCVDYNWFNFSNTSKKLKDYLKIDSNLELARFYAESFEKYSKVRKKLSLNEKYISLSTFKRSWIIEELSGNSTQKFAGFY